MAPVQRGRGNRSPAAFAFALGLGLFAAGCDRPADPAAVPGPVDPLAVGKITGELQRLTKQVESLQATIGKLSDQVARLEQAKAADAAPKTISAAERLQKPITLTFPRNTLEVAIKLVGSGIGVPIEILTDDLKMEGVTQNQSFGLDERNQPAEEILLRILRRANPDGKLVYIIKNVPGEGERIVVTTRVAAERRGETLPAALKRGATLGHGVWMDDGEFHGWPAIISRQILETEIKDQIAALAKLTEKQAAFRGNGAQRAEGNLTLLAVLFQIVENYGQEVAWKGQTLGLRYACARCAEVCRHPEDQFADGIAAPENTNLATFERLKALNVQLQRLITEGVGEPGTAVNSRAWHTYINRPTLMDCQEEIGRRQFERWLSDPREFADHAAEALRRAEILAVISVVIHDPGFESANDPQYQVHARSYHAACLELARTLRAEPTHPLEYESVKAACKRLSKACDACHADYR
jgi:hypothetical protein